MVKDVVDGRAKEDDRRPLGSVLGYLGCVEGAAKLGSFVIDVLQSVEHVDKMNLIVKLGTQFSDSSPCLPRQV